ncbi:FAD-binding protein [Mycena sanguinolenta]|uniref:FAD-binding protein n=1 Tax=Mycena sanguinolenta TaxID=230812 RepID=A0A8H6X7J4_9AGAR|nr:FAD-binding protein [Mycena sanguinolenta]
MFLFWALVPFASLLVAAVAYDNSTRRNSPREVHPASAASSACDAILHALGSSVVQSSGSEYNATTQDTWNLFDTLDQPTCIVYPHTVSDFQVAMADNFRFGSHYAVQAGAHSAMVGYNSITDGVLISFANMTSTTYNSQTGTVTVQPGVRWGEAMAAIEHLGLSVLGGRASDIGTGILLGGGISYIAPLYGWSADSIKEMDVVLVTGELVTATATNAYSDLFRALKGGANRFVVVTRYELFPIHTGTKEQKNWFGGSILYPASSSIALLEASARYVRENTDTKAGFIAIMNTIPSDVTTTVYLFYNGLSLPHSIFGEFLSIPNTSVSLSPLSYFDISNLVPGNARGNGQQFGAASSEAFAADLFTSDLVISPIPRSQWKATKTGANAIGDPGVAYAAINYHLVHNAGVTVQPPGIQAGFELLLEQCVISFLPYFFHLASGVLIPPTHRASSSPGLPLYINECDVSQNVFKTYPSFAVLQKTYAKYDPSRFNVEHTTGPIGL